MFVSNDSIGCGNSYTQFSIRHQNQYQSAQRKQVQFTPKKDIREENVFNYNQQPTNKKIYQNNYYNSNYIKQGIQNTLHKTKKHFQTSQDQCSDYNISVVYQQKNQQSDQQYSHLINNDTQNSQNYEIQNQIQSKISKFKLGKSDAFKKQYFINKKLKDIQRVMGQVILEDQKQISRIQQRKLYQIQKIHTFYEQKINSLNNEWQKKLQKIQKIYEKDINIAKEDSSQLIDKMEKDFQQQITKLQIQKEEITLNQEQKRNELVKDHKNQLIKVQSNYLLQIENLKSNHNQYIKETELNKQIQIKQLKQTIQIIKQQNIKMKQIMEKEWKQKQLKLKKQFSQLFNNHSKQIQNLETQRKRQQACYKNLEDKNLRNLLEEKATIIKDLQNRIRKNNKQYEKQIQQLNKKLYQSQAKIKLISNQLNEKVSELKLKHGEELRMNQLIHKRQILSNKQSQIVEKIKKQNQQKLDIVMQNYESQIQNLNDQLLKAKNQTLKIFSSMKRQNNIEIAKKQQYYRNQINKLQKIYQNEQKNWQINHEQNIKYYYNQISKIRQEQSINYFKTRRKQHENQMRKKINQKIKEIGKLQAQISALKIKNSKYRKQIDDIKSQFNEEKLLMNKKIIQRDTQIKNIKKNQLNYQNTIIQKQIRINQEINKNYELQAQIKQLKIKKFEKDHQRDKQCIDLQLRQYKQKIVFITTQHKAQTSYLKNNFNKVSEEKQIKHKLQIKCLNQKIDYLTQKIKQKQNEIQNQRKIHQSNISIFIQNKSSQKTYQRAKSYNKNQKNVNYMKMNNSQQIQSCENNKFSQLIEKLKSSEKDKLKLQEQIKILKNTNKQLRIMINTSISRFQKEKQMHEQIGQLKSKLKYFEQIQRKSSHSKEKPYFCRSKSKQLNQNNYKLQSSVTTPKSNNYQLNLNQFKNQSNDLLKKTCLKGQKKQVINLNESSKLDYLKYHSLKNEQGNQSQQMLERKLFNDKKYIFNKSSMTVIRTYPQNNYDNL